MKEHMLKVEMGEFTTYKLTCHLTDEAECHQTCVTHPEGHDDIPDDHPCTMEVYRNGCTLAEWVNDGGIEAVQFDHTIELPVRFEWVVSHDYPMMLVLTEGETDE